MTSSRSCSKCEESAYLFRQKICIFLFSDIKMNMFTGVAVNLLLKWQNISEAEKCILCNIGFNFIQNSLD